MILPWTGREKGDDTGYRDVKVVPDDDTDPDFLVDLEDHEIECYPVYAHGAEKRICPYYGNGLGASARVLIREPVALALDAVNTILARYHRQLLVLDGFRPCAVQQALFADQVQQLLSGRDATSLSISEFVHLGRRADDVGSYAAVRQDDAFLAAQAALLDGQMADQVAAAAFDLQVTREEVARLYLTFRANLGMEPTITLDPSAPTAHGSGGAVDLILVDSLNDEEVLSGTPFDYARPPDDAHPTGASAMRYFEDEGNFVHYRELVARDPVLREFLSGFGVTEVTPEVFQQIRGERRVLFHTMTLAGFTHFFLEWWHFNGNNQFGGRQFGNHPFAGNACHAVLVDSCGEYGKRVAVWGNTKAHMMAANLLK